VSDCGQRIGPGLEPHRLRGSLCELPLRQVAQFAVPRLRSDAAVIPGFADVNGSTASRATMGAHVDTAGVDGQTDGAAPFGLWSIHFTRLHRTAQNCVVLHGSSGPEYARRINHPNG